MNWIQRNIDKITHLSVSFTLVCLFTVVLPLPISCWMVWMLGILKELVDKHNYGLFSIGDLIADTVGIVSAIVVLGCIT